MNVTFKTPARRGGFTLIELLAVIAIIGLLAAMVLGTAGLATGKMREARVRAEHGRLVTAIEAYKAAMGNYPPDNPGLLTAPIADRHEKAGRNSLFYELSGVIYTNVAGGEFVTANRTERVKAADLKTAFGVKGVENSAREKKRIPFRGVNFKTSQYQELALPGVGDVEILVHPLKGPHDAKFPRKNATLGMNPWFYDASSTNRHNLEGFDLWAEYTTSQGTAVIGNW